MNQFRYNYNRDKKKEEQAGAPAQHKHRWWQLKGQRRSYKKLKAK